MRFRVIGDYLSQIDSQYRVNLTQIFFNYSESLGWHLVPAVTQIFRSNDSIFSSFSEAAFGFFLHCSEFIVEKYKKLQMVKNRERWVRKNKLSLWNVRKCLRDVNLNPNNTSKAILNYQSSSSIEISKSTVQRALRKEGLTGCRPRKAPLLQKWHINPLWTEFFFSSFFGT